MLDRTGRCDGSSDAYELSNVVETPLARALVLAAEAKRWDVVVQIVTELEGRRLVASGKPTRVPGPSAKRGQ